MTRQQLIDKGKIYQVEERDKNKLLFEGTRSKCIAYMRQKGILRQWKQGKSNYTLSKVIYEISPLKKKYVPNILQSL